MKVTLYGYIYEHHFAYMNPKDLNDPAKVLAGAHFSPRPVTPSMGAVPIGQIEVDVELVPADELLAGVVAMLRVKAAGIRKEAKEKANEVEAKIQSLLALPMSKGD